MIVYQHFSAEACGKTWVINLKKSLKLQLWAQSRLPTMTQNWKFHSEIIGEIQEVSMAWGVCFLKLSLYQIDYLLNYSWKLQKVCKCFDRCKMVGKTNGNTNYVNFFLIWFSLWNECHNFLFWYFGWISEWNYWLWITVATELWRLGAFFLPPLNEKKQVGFKIWLRDWKS